MQYTYDTLACFLFKDPATKDDILSLVRGWTKSDSGWLWKAALFTYARLDAPGKYGDLKALLQEKMEE